MNLSKNAFNEILKKCKKRFPRQVGSSIDAGNSWENFCAKNPVEFSGTMNGAKYIIRVSNDAYAVCVLNPSGFFKIYSF